MIIPKVALELWHLQTDETIDYLEDLADGKVTRPEPEEPDDYN